MPIRKIANFGDAGNHEYCLCERPDAWPPAADNEKSRVMSSHAAQRSRTASGQSMTGQGQTFLKIFLPNDDYTVLAIDHSTTGQDLLPQLQKKHRLQLFADELIFKISAAERDRLKLETEMVDMHTKLQPLGAQELTLGARKLFLVQENFKMTVSRRKIR